MVFVPVVFTVSEFFLITITGKDGLNFSLLNEYRNPLLIEEMGPTNKQTNVFATQTK